MRVFNKDNYLPRKTAHQFSKTMSKLCVSTEQKQTVLVPEIWPCKVCLPVLRLSAKLLRLIPAFSNFLGEIHI